VSYLQHLISGFRNVVLVTMDNNQRNVETETVSLEFELPAPLAETVRERHAENRVVLAAFRRGELDRSLVSASD
jgi:hypothetical protein